MADVSTAAVWATWLGSVLRRKQKKAGKGRRGARQEAKAAKEEVKAAKAEAKEAVKAVAKQPDGVQRAKNSGHLPDQCWVTYPHLQKTKKVQAVEGGEEELNFIDLGVLEVSCNECGQFQEDGELYEDKRRAQEAYARVQMAEVASHCCPPGLGVTTTEATKMSGKMALSMVGETSPDYSGHTEMETKMET